MDNLNSVERKNLLQVIANLSKQVRLLESEVLKLKKRVEVLEAA